MRLNWTALAVDDRAAILDYIARDHVPAALATAARIEQQVERLIDLPHSGRPGRIDGTRELVIDGTPYVVAYKVTGDTIRLLRVLHGAPQWLDRLL